MGGVSRNLVVGVHGTYTYLFREQVPHRFDLFRAYSLIDRAVVLSRDFENFWNHFCPSLYIPNPIQICSREERSSLAGNVVLWVGRFSEEKQPLDAVRAFAQVKAKLPNSATLVMLGTGEAEVVKRVQSLVCELGLEDGVLLPGYHVDVSSYYKKACVLLFTSAFEGFPMTIA